MGNSNWDDDDGLPDAAFTQDELDAGVQHIMRSGSADAGRSRYLGEEQEDESQAQPAPARSPGGVLRFATYAEAKAWAMANPGSPFSRAADGRGFEAKVRVVVSATQASRPTSTSRMPPDDPERGVWGLSQFMEELKVLSPEVHGIWHKSGSRGRTLLLYPFSNATFVSEIERLSGEKRARLREILAVILQCAKKDLKDLEAIIRRDRRMWSGDYGVEMDHRLNELHERAIVILDEYIGKMDRAG